jgi:hypothetical protein
VKPEVVVRENLIAAARQSDSVFAEGENFIAATGRSAGNEQQSGCLGEFCAGPKYVVGGCMLSSNS